MVSQSTQKLIQKYQEWYQSLKPRTGVSTIHVDEVASAIASFYEKIRGVVEWREEHLLRRAAIERILKRRLMLQKNDQELAEPFVLELIRGGHFPNDQIEETKIEGAKNILNKYFFIFENSPRPPKEKVKIQLYDWFLNICACEIEELLSPPIKEKILIEYMAELMKERIEIIEKKFFISQISKEEKETQVYIAVQRALFKLDAPIITYSLLKKKYPNWSTLSQAQLREIADNIYFIWEEMEKNLKHPLSERFYRICERYDTLYLILGNIISQNPPESQKKLEDPEILEKSIREAYRLRLSKLKSRLTRAAVYSTISIFLTKMLIAFAVEVPFDKYFLKEFSYRALEFNILIPPLLMFFLVLTIRPPRKENLERVIMETMKLVYEKERKDVYTIKLPRKRGLILNFIIVIFYLLTYIVTFGLIIWGLDKLNFGILSIIIFLIFFSLIAFAGVKIRERARELDIMEKRAGFFTFLIDTFSLPILRLGRWLSSQWVKYNIVLVLITAFIDLPFQIFTEFVEHWRTFLKEKRDEIH
jgi:hypothetical protein